MTMATTASTGVVSDERADLLESLRLHRGFLRFTVRGLNEEQIRLRTTASELCLGGLIKHVTAGERGWTDFILDGPAAMGDFTAMTPEEQERWAARSVVEPGETLEGLLEEYAAVAARTDAIVATLPDLGVSHPLPRAPWFEEGARWSARRTLLHIIAETAQHAGHADIIRETLDGQKTMG
ncbi:MULTISPECIES: DinB family protein [Streptomyces]|uniref:DinB family protein n=1 Tax=Streptomyces TaxID=1883 RepID=UPI0005B80196|nr:DinB family protein [Streptomyces sp. NRRL F-2890]